MSAVQFHAVHPRLLATVGSLTERFNGRFNFLCRHSTSVRVATRFQRRG